MLYEVGQSMFYREGTLVVVASRKRCHLGVGELKKLARLHHLTISRYGTKADRETFNSVFWLEGWLEDLEAVVSVVQQRLKLRVYTHKKSR